MTKSIRSTVETNTAVALYARVSTEDQAERQTIQSQQMFLKRHCDLYGVTVAGEYTDDGISGTVPLDRREAGRRLLADAEAGQFGAVLVYRVDRLGRSLTAILDAHTALDTLGIAIRSATEPIDTATPIGRFIFQLLASLAELDRNTIADRMSTGRDRIAGTGKYTGGPIPLGYDVNADGYFIPSERIVPQLGMTEAEMVADIFRRIASHETTLNAECKRLTALGVPRMARYNGKDGNDGARYFRTGRWSYRSLSSIIHNPSYMGMGTVKSRFGDVPRPMPALVSPEIWEQAKAALNTNRTLSAKPTDNTYWLRGMVRCERCGGAYVGTTSHGRRKYRCRGAGHVGGEYTAPCRSRRFDAEELESLVWAECVRFIENPGDALDEARRKLRESMGKAAGFETRRRNTLAALADKETERERILTFFRKGTISADEAEMQLDAIAGEAGQLREDLESMRARSALLEAQESLLTDSATMLVRLQTELADIEATDDWSRRREVIEQYVRQITIETVENGKRRKDAVARVYLRLEPGHIASDSDRQSPIAGH